MEDPQKQGDDEKRKFHLDPPSPLILSKRYSSLLDLGRPVDSVLFSPLPGTVIACSGQSQHIRTVLSVRKCSLLASGIPEDVTKKFSLPKKLLDSVGPFGYHWPLGYQ